MGHHGDDVCGGGCVDARWNYCTIPTVGNLRGRSFLSLIGVKLLKRAHGGILNKLWLAIVLVSDA
jgi:hypothetical protein